MSTSTGDIFIVYDDIKGKMRDKNGYLLVFVAVLFLFLVITSRPVMQAANAAIITKLLNK